MVSKNSLLKAGAISALASIANAQSLFTPIDFKSSLDLYYYFKSGNAIAAITDEGIDIEGSFSSNDELCQALDGAQLVYSSDKGEDVLLTSNCFSVYHLVDNSSSEITWSSCQEFPFFANYCPGGSASGSASATLSSTTLSSTATAAQNSVSGSETLYLTTVTSTINNIETIYTTYCPLSEITASRSQPASISGGTTNINAVNGAQSVQTSTYVVTENGSESTFTTLIPISGSAAGIAGAAGPQKTFVDNTDFYETLESHASAATSVSGSDTYVLSTVTSTIGNIATIYTTYCPISEIATGSAPATVASETPAPSAQRSTTGAASAGTESAAPSVHSTVVSSVVTNSDNGEVSTVLVQTTYTVGTTSAPAATGATVSQQGAPPGSGSVAQQGASSSAGSVAPAITSFYEGGAAQVISSISLASFVAIFFGLFC